ncbi:MAG: hypothetical protein ACYDH9_06660 [Limisphaerales bacterium]
MKALICILLNLFVGLFLADAVASLADDTLILLFGSHLLSMVRGIVFLFAVLMAIVIYGLMGLTPLVRKRLFLPAVMFYPLAAVAVVPVSIYHYGRLEQFAWVLSVCQSMLGVGILYALRGELRFRWPLVPEEQPGNRRFSWLNLSGFLVVNIFVLPPAAFGYVALCAFLAVDHFSDGFLALRTGGLTVRVREYLRADGKRIRLIPMAHVGEADFYRGISQSFPTNSIILMEGVTDHSNLLTNKITYKRMAASLGLAEQKEEFAPSRGELVPADIDVDQFSTNTIGFLNLVTLIHSKGVNAANVLKLIRYSPPAGFEEQLYDDLLRKRNQHLLEQIRARLPQSENVMVPWGVAHMPEIARGIQKSGFRLVTSREYPVIRFFSVWKQERNVQ